MTLEKHEILERLKKLEDAAALVVGEASDLLTEIGELMEEFQEPKCGCDHLASEHHYQNGCTICDCERFTK